MKPLNHACCAMVTLVAAIAAGQPWSKPLNAAADAVEDAYDRALRSNGKCRNQIGPGLDALTDRIDGLGKLASPLGELNQVRTELAVIGQQAPFAACPLGVTDDIQRGLDSLETVRVAMWNDSRGGGSRRDQRRGARPAAPTFPFVQLSPIRVTPALPFQNERAVQLSVPEMRFEAMQGQGFYVATRFRSFEGDWSDWVATQVWTVPASPFVWRNAYNHVLRYSTLAEEDFSNGRFIAHVAVFTAQGQELAFREIAFRVTLPQQVVVPPQPPPVVRRDCGTGPNDPGCMMMRDGQFAMEAATYLGFMQSLRANRSEMMRGSMASSMLENNFMTAAQFEPILDLFNSEVMKLDFAQRAAPKLVNPQHAIGFSTKFRSSMMQSGYTQLMAQQPVGVVIVVQQPSYPQPAVVQPGVVVQFPVQPAVMQQVVGRDCGTGPNDPGCGLMRGGFQAMDATVFQGMIQSLRAVTNEITREDMFEKLIARNGMTAMQLSSVLDLFNNSITKLEIAKLAASHVVNPQHALGLSTKFNNSFQAEEFVEIYSEQR
jgi:hypothetical protein